MDAAAELGRNPVSKHQIQPEYGDEHADAGRDLVIYRYVVANPVRGLLDRKRSEKHLQRSSESMITRTKQ